MTTTTAILFESRWDGSEVTAGLRGVGKEALKIGKTVGQSLRKATKEAIDGLKKSLRDGINEAGRGLSGIENPWEKLRTVILGVSASITGSLVVSMKLALDANRAAGRSFDRLIKSMKETASTFGQIVLAAVDFKNATDDARVATDDFNKRLRQNAVAVKGTIIDVLQAGVTVVDFVGRAGIGIVGLFDVAVAALGELGMAIGTKIWPGILRTASSAFEELRQLVIKFALFLRNNPHLTVGAEKMAQGILGPNGLANMLGSVAGTTDRVAGAMAGVKSTMDGVDVTMVKTAQRADKFRKSMADVYSTLERNRKGGVSFGNLPGEGGEGANPLIRSDVRLDTFTTGQTDFAQIGRDMAELSIKGERLKLRLRDVKQELLDTAANNAAAQKFRELGEAIGTTLLSSLTSTTAALGKFFGAFAVGESSLAKFGDAMADLASNIAGTFGELFIRMGVGMITINPVTGGALIAAGLGLQFLSGVLGAKGSANATGKGRSAATTSSSDVARVAGTLDNRTTRDQQVTNLKIVILGEDMEGPVERWWRDMDRRGRLT